MMHKQVLDLYVGGAWAATWTGSSSTSTSSTVQTGSRQSQSGRTITTTNSFRTTTTTTTTRTGTENRSGDRLRVSEQTEVINEGDRVVSSDVIAFMRSRNIEFTGRKFKPRTRVYGFFDGTNVNNFVVPKLLEIRMISGSFSVGETVTGTMPTSATPTVGNSTPTILSELLSPTISMDQLMHPLMYIHSVHMTRTTQFQRTIQVLPSFLM